MDIKFHSTVLICNDHDKMKAFYQDTLLQSIEVDFGNCIVLKNGLSLWKLSPEYPLANKLGRTFHNAGNNNMEICFETEDFEQIANKLSNVSIRFIHKETEETWGQLTIRFYDPENNIIEIGESIPCFVKRFYNQGLSIEEVSQRTSVPASMVKEICIR